VTEVTQQRRDQMLTRSPNRAVGLRASEPVTLADLLERILDKGIVIAGDIKLYLGEVELLTLKIRLLIASVDKAQEIGINWWESDPALSSQNRELRKQRDELVRRVERIEEHTPGLEPEPPREWGTSEPALSAQNRELRKQRDELQQRLGELETRLAEHEQQSEKSDDRGSQRRRKQS
jgi:uncharacterized protein YlxW (UPF0749 family)